MHAPCTGLHGPPSHHRTLISYMSMGSTILGIGRLMNLIATSLVVMLCLHSQVCPLPPSPRSFITCTRNESEIKISRGAFDYDARPNGAKSRRGAIQREFEMRQRGASQHIAHLPIANVEIARVNRSLCSPHTNPQVRNQEGHRERNCIDAPLCGLTALDHPV